MFIYYESKYNDIADIILHIQVMKLFRIKAL